APRRPDAPSAPRPGPIVSCWLSRRVPVMFRFRTWLRQLSRGLFASGGRRLRGRRGRRRMNARAALPPRIERLEDYILPSTVVWTAGSGNWTVAANWTDQSNSTHHVPTTTDDAVINTSVTVTYSAGSTLVVNSLTLGLSGGTAA